MWSFGVASSLLLLCAVAVAGASATARGVVRRARADAVHTRVLHFRSHHGCAFGRHGARRVRHAVRGVCPRLSVGGPLAPSTTAHWVGSAGQDLLIHATDSGSGVTEVKLQVDGRTVDSKRESCPWGRCRLNYDAVAPYVSDGTHTVTAVARDAAGNTTTLPSWTIDVDQTPPVVAVSGTGFRNENPPASSGTLSLRVSAKDANRPKSGPPASGVVAITTYVDEDGLIGGPAASRACPQGSCSLSSSGLIDLSQLSPGSHVVEVTATDAAGNVGAQTWTINVAVPTTPSSGACPPFCLRPISTPPTASTASGVDGTVTVFNAVSATRDQSSTPAAADQQATASPIGSNCATSVNVTSGYYDQWSSSGTAFKELARDGFKCVVIVAQMFAKDRYYKKLTDPQNPGHTSGDSSFSTFCNGSRVLPAGYKNVKTAIGMAESHGLKVILKPHVDSLHSDTSLYSCSNLWRGLIDPAGSSDPSSYKSWWSDYYRDMGEWAQLSQSTHAAALVIGTEFSGLTSNTRDSNKWTTLISQLRQTYHGPLGYATNWDAIKQGGTGFFSNLDFVGIDGYYGLVGSPGAAHNASVSTLSKGWGSMSAPANSNCSSSNFQGDHNGSLGQAQRVECAYQLYKKPIVFTEIGYESNNDTAYQPYNDFSGSASDALTNQQRAIDAYYQYFGRWAEVTDDPNGPREWLDGTWWWNADITKPDANDKKWTLRHKPAMVDLCQRQDVSKSTCVSANPST